MRLQRNLKSAVASVGRISAFVALGFCNLAAHALTISPVLVELSPARRIVSITMSNRSDQAISFQAQTLAWTQPDGVDHYTDTDDLVVVPPIAEIVPGGSQIFRVTLRRPPGPQEQAYRLIFEDVTETTTPASDEVAVNLRVNHNLPVFVVAPGKPRAQPRLVPCTTPDLPSAVTKGCIRLINDGGRYAQVKSLAVESSTWHQDLSASTRVLAGAWRQWTFDIPSAASASLHVRAETSDGPVTADLPLPPH